MQFSVSEHVTSAAVALNRVLSMWESSHQADMQIIISLKEEKDKMFRGNRSRLGTSFYEQALVLGLSPGLLVLWDCVCVRENTLLGISNVFSFCLRASPCESVREWSVVSAIPQVSDIWSSGLIGPRRAWHSARTIMPHTHPQEVCGTTVVVQPFVKGS